MTTVVFLIPPASQGRENAKKWEWKYTEYLPGKNTVKYSTFRDVGSCKLR